MELLSVNVSWLFHSSTPGQFKNCTWKMNEENLMNQGWCWRSCIGGNWKYVSKRSLLVFNVAWTMAFWVVFRFQICPDCCIYEGLIFSKFWLVFLYKPFFFLKVPTPHPKGVFAYIVQESNWHCHLIPLIWIIGTHQLYQLYALWGCMGKKLADSCPLLLWEVEIHATWLAARQENYTQLKKHQCYS